MPRPSLSITQIKVEKEINKLDSVLNGTQALPANLQYLIAEILLIRVTTIFEDALAQLAYKLAAGALYLDGSAPNILLPCRSLASARTNMQLGNFLLSSNYVRTPNLRRYFVEVKVIVNDCVKL